MSGPRLGRPMVERVLLGRRAHPAARLTGSGTLPGGTLETPRGHVTYHDRVIPTERRAARQTPLQRGSVEWRTYGRSGDGSLPT